MEVCRKHVIANKIARFGGLNYYFLIILSELTIKYVKGFGRVITILKDPWKQEKGTIIFNVQQNRVLCRPEDCFSGQQDC